VRVLDFGGASGYFRNYVDTFFDGKIRTDWLIVETEQQVSHNANLGLSDVRYSTTIGDQAFDIALFSGSLHYIEKWMLPLRQTNAELIFIARTPLGSSNQPFLQRVMHEGRTLAYPGQVIVEDALFAELRRTHQMIARWDFRSNLLEMGWYDAPATLWERGAKLSA